VDPRALQPAGRESPSRTHSALLMYICVLAPLLFRTDVRQTASAALASACPAPVSFCMSVASI
jgi:hypothetical protein